MEADEHESAPSQIPRLGMHDGKRESSSHGGIDGIPAGLHHLNSSAGRQLMNAYYDRVPRMDWMNRRSPKLQPCRRHNREEQGQ
jgi:hypothetical protein